MRIVAALGAGGAWLKLWTCYYLPSIIYGIDFEVLGMRLFVSVLVISLWLKT